MKTIHKLGLFVACLIFGVGSLEAQTTLRFQFKEGDKLGYDMQQNMKMSMNIMGKDITVNMDQTMSMVWQILKVDSSGAAQIKISLTGMKMVMDGPMGKVEVDSKNPKQLDDPVGKALSQVVNTIGGMEMTFTMDGSGDIKDMQIPEKVKESFKSLPGAAAMGDLLSDESLMKMAHGGIALPKEPVTKGKTWTKKADMKLPMGRFKGDVQFTYEGNVEKDGKKLEKIALKPNFTIEPGPDAQFKMKFKNQDGKGFMYFDNTAGRLVEVDSTQNMEMTIEANNMNMEQKIEQKTTMKLAK